jgi:hypothetical protein
MALVGAPLELGVALWAGRSSGRPFSSRADLRYLEQGSGPLAVELVWLWRAKGATKGPAGPSTMRAAQGVGWRAVPRGRLGWRHAAPPAR